MKRLGFLVLFLVLGVCIVFSAPNVKPYLTFKVGTEHNKTSFFYTGLMRFKELVEGGTNGGVQVQLYDSAALGSEGEMSEGVAMGTVDACLVGSSSIAKLIPSFNVLSLPYLFVSNAHVDAVFNSQIGQQFKDLLLEKKGVV
jgi:TRAP-type C4-dicarboxylate transport system, periplasmic component